MAYTVVKSVRPKASETPVKPSPRCRFSGATVVNAAASTALPQPPSTNQAVPMD
jgi:hypothetical protein